jgi:hypothetical protein
MLSLAGIYVALAILFWMGWIGWFRHLNHRRSQRALRWIEVAFDGHGQLAGVHWAGPSCFRVQLRLRQDLFQHASVAVHLLPRESPLGWLRAAWGKQQEVLTFTSDLELPPDFDLLVENHRWCGRTRRHMPALEALHTMRSTPFMITTRSEWQNQSAMLDALIASRERDFLSVNYRRESPHFAATLPLECLDPHGAGVSEFFDVLRELAGGASASRM